MFQPLEITQTPPGVQSLAAADARAYSVRIASSAEELEGMRSLWEGLNGNPNAQIDFFQLINAARKSLPHVLVLERDGVPRGLVIGRIARQDFRCRLGYKTFVLGGVRELSVVYGGLLAGDEPAAVEAVLREFGSMLRRREIDVVFFNHLDTATHLFQRAIRRPGLLCRDRLTAPQLHWKTRLPATRAEVVQRLHKKRRNWLRGLEKTIEQDFPGQVSYRSVTDSQQLVSLMNDMEKVAGKTYQRRLGAGFRNDAEFTERLGFEAKKEWLRAYVLYLKDQPVAFWIGAVYKGVFYSDMTGYDPNFRDYGVGTLIFMNMIDHLCQEHVAAIDYGLGDALYKRRFGDESWNEASVRIFAPSVRAIALNLAQTAIESPVRLVQSILARTNLRQRLKTFWRKKLVSAEGSP